jgi:predicted TIM-barrel fold metal-dependent hydrolase
LRRWTGEQFPGTEIPLPVTLAAMDAAGVDHGLIAAWRGPHGQDLISNDDVAQWVSQADGRLSGLATADLDKPVAAVRELRRRVRDDGFVGLRIVPWLWNAPPTDRRYYPLFCECVELDVPFCTQVGHTGPLAPSETGRPIPYIDQVAIDFPELRIVAGHLGYPWTEEMIAVARKHENVFIDTSAYTLARVPQAFIDYANSRSGRRKVMFGSNFPMIQPQHALEALPLMGFDEETTRLFLHDNAARVFKLDSQRD